LDSSRSELQRIDPGSGGSAPDEPGVAIPESEAQEPGDPEAGREAARLVANWLVAYEGRIMSWSKSGYHRHYPAHLAVFNARLMFPGDDQPFWWGDLDITVDEARIRELAAVLDESVAVTYEWYGDRPAPTIGVFHPDGQVDLDDQRAGRHPTGLLVPSSWASLSLAGLRPEPAPAWLQSDAEAEGE